MKTELLTHGLVKLLDIFYDFLCTMWESNIVSELEQDKYLYFMVSAAIVVFGSH